MTALRTDILEPNGAGNGNSFGDRTLARGDALQQVRTNFTTAVSVQKPRHLPEVERRLVQEAQLAGESFYYGWGAGDNKIEGPSIELAVAAARCWGNCATDMLPMQDLADCWVFTAVFIDLETGYTRTRQFRQSKKWTVHGKLDAERKDDVRFQIGQSKAERNVILKALPAWLIDHALQAAKAGVKARIEQFIKEKGLPAAVDMVLRALAKQGVKEPQVLAKLGIAARTAIDLDMLVILRGDLHALESGQERAEALFPVPQEQAKAAAKAKTDELADRIKGKSSNRPVEPLPEEPVIQPDGEVDSSSDPASVGQAFPAEPPAAVEPKRSRRLTAALIAELCQRAGFSVDDVCQEYGVPDLGELTAKQLQECNERLSAAIRERAQAEG